MKTIVLDITLCSIAACSTKSHHFGLYYQVLCNFFFELSLYTFRKYHLGLIRHCLHMFAGYAWMVTAMSENLALYHYLSYLFSPKLKKETSFCATAMKIPMIGKFL